MRRKPSAGGEGSCEKADDVMACAGHPQTPRPPGSLRPGSPQRKEMSTTAKKKRLQKVLKKRGKLRLYLHPQNP